MYNIEPYVERCLRSLEDQDIPKTDYEIICINDGSPDNSREIVMKMQKEFDNIILIDQENQGVSRARNIGIDKASGKYIIFIDPDDYVDSNSFRRILNNIDKQKAQVSFLGFTFLNENGTIRKQIFNKKLTSQIYLGTDTYFLARYDEKTDPDRMVAVIFETKFIKDNNLRYLPDVPYLEDGEFISRILCLAERCIFDGYSFYQRTTRPASATNSTLFLAERANKGFLLAARNLKKFQQEKNLNERQKIFLNQPICKFVILVIDSARKPFVLRKIEEKRKILNESGLGKLHLRSVDKEFTRLGFFYNLSVYLLIFYLVCTNITNSFRIRLKGL